ncbi:MAG: hypothetical protein RJB34_964 [Pseudomonadota bacterium]
MNSVQPPQFAAWVSGFTITEIIKSQNPQVRGVRGGVGGCKSLTMTYFHTGIRTIIGANLFHCPVRDGKEWDQVAMVVRHKRLSG